MGKIPVHFPNFKVKFNIKEIIFHLRKNTKEINLNYLVYMDINQKEIINTSVVIKLYLDNPDPSKRFICLEILFLCFNKFSSFTKTFDLDLLIFIN